MNIELAKTITAHLNEYLSPESHRPTADRIQFDVMTSCAVPPNHFYWAILNIPANFKSSDHNLGLWNHLALTLPLIDPEFHSRLDGHYMYRSDIVLELYMKALKDHYHITNPDHFCATYNEFFGYFIAEHGPQIVELIVAGYLQNRDFIKPRSQPKSWFVRVIEFFK